MNPSSLERKAEHGQFLTDVMTISNGLKQLTGRTSFNIPVSEELAWEIKLYRWILDQPDAGLKARAFLNLRHSGRGSMSKREVVKKLKWEI